MSCRAGVGLSKGLKYFLLALGGNSDAGVLYIKLDHGLRTGRIHRHIQMHMAGMGELYRIADQIDQTLPQASRIGQDFHRQTALRADFESRFFFSAAGCKRFDAGQHIRQRAGNIFYGQFARLDLGKVQNVIDKSQQRFPLPGSNGENSLEELTGLSPEQFGEAENSVHRSSDLMAHIRQKDALGLIGTIRFFRHFVGFCFVPEVLRFADAPVVRFGYCDCADPQIKHQEGTEQSQSPDNQGI